MTHTALGDMLIAAREADAALSQSMYESPGVVTMRRAHTSVRYARQSLRRGSRRASAAEMSSRFSRAPHASVYQRER